MGLASGLSAGIGVLGGVSNMISGAKQASDAKNALENYERQKLENIAEGLQVSTLGSDLQREEQARLASGQVASAREGGARTMIGSLGRIEAGNQAVNRQIGADLDAQQKAIDQMRAEDEARIRSMQENREIGDISALSSQITAGEQVKAAGLAQSIQGLSTLGNTFGEKAGTKDTEVSDVYSKSPTPAGMTDLSSKQSTISAPLFNSLPQYNSQRYNPMTYAQNQNPFVLPNPPQITKI